MSDFAGERTYTQEEVDKLLDKYITMTYEVLEALHDIKEGSETQQITCKTCGVENVPDWKDGDCITCARDKILGSETQLTLQELDKMFPTWFKKTQVTFSGQLPLTEDERQQVLVVPYVMFEKAILALFQQALTSVKSEMEKRKKRRGESPWTYGDKMFNEAISECQRVIEEWGKK